MNGLAVVLLRFLAPLDSLAYAGRSLDCTGMVRSSASIGMTTDCHSRGGAKQLYGVYQPSLTQRPTVANNGDAPETSPFRTTGYSKRWLDPTRVTATPGTRRGFETSVELSPRHKRRRLS